LNSDITCTQPNISMKFVGTLKTHMLNLVKSSRLKNIWEKSKRGSQITQANWIIPQLLLLRKGR